MECKISHMESLSRFYKNSEVSYKFKPTFEVTETAWVKAIGRFRASCTNISYANVARSTRFDVASRKQAQTWAVSAIY